MSRKVKCIECGCSMHWALPEKIGSRNIEYAKRCLSATRSIVCGETMKTKLVEHEQYCKRFMPKTELDLKIDELYQTKIAHLAEMIQTYESQLNCHLT